MNHRRHLPVEGVSPFWSLPSTLSGIALPLVSTQSDGDIHTLFNFKRPVNITDIQYFCAHNPKKAHYAEEEYRNAYQTMTQAFSPLFIFKLSGLYLSVELYISDLI
jgi:hypothetical protein